MAVSCGHTTEAADAMIPLLADLSDETRAGSETCGLYSIGSPRSFTNGTLYSRRIAVMAA